MHHAPIRLGEKLEQIRDPWSPRIIASLNNYHCKLAKLKGDFVWHKHDETDEAFIVLKGSMRIDFRDGSVALEAGEMYVVPRGVPHKPSSESGCSVLLIEPAGTLNTGDTGGEYLVENPEWI